MRLEIDPQEPSVSFSAPKSVYSQDGLRIAAHVFATRAEVLVAKYRDSYAVTLKSKRRSASQADLEALAGEFLNELLNQEYRFLVGRFNHKISGLIVTQVLLAARGGEQAVKPPSEERSAEFQAAVAVLMKEAEEEALRTMPKRIAPQGRPLPPAPEGG